MMKFIKRIESTGLTIDKYETERYIVKKYMMEGDAPDIRFNPKDVGPVAEVIGGNWVYSFDGGNMLTQREFDRFCESLEELQTLVQEVKKMMQEGTI